MQYINDLLTVCGAISIVGGAVTLIVKGVQSAIKPTNDLKKRVDTLEKGVEKDRENISEMKDLQRSIAKSQLGLVNHAITGNGIDNLKKIRDELTDTIVDK